MSTDGRPLVMLLPTFTGVRLIEGAMYWSRDWTGEWCRLRLEVDRPGPTVLVREETGATVWWPRTALTDEAPVGAEAPDLSKCDWTGRRRLKAVERAMKDLAAASAEGDWDDAEDEQ